MFKKQLITIAPCTAATVSSPPHSKEDRKSEATAETPSPVSTDRKSTASTASTESTATICDSEAQRSPRLYSSLINPQRLAAVNRKQQPTNLDKPQSLWKRSGCSGGVESTLDPILPDQDQQLHQQQAHPLPMATAPSSPVARQLRGLSATTEKWIPFSWLQCALSTFAYLWLLSNFLRTSFAIRDLAEFHTGEPDIYVCFGPYAYTGNVFTEHGGRPTVLSNVTSKKPVALWSYKFDTTSIAMRAFAEHLNVTEFPDCLFYTSKCESDFLTPTKGFSMMNALVDAVHTGANDTSTTIQGSSDTTATPALATQDPKFYDTRPQTILLRAKFSFFDRIHHYLMPQVFVTPIWRTCQAIYYSGELLSKVAQQAVALRQSENQLEQRQQNETFVEFCSHAYGGVRPFFCDDLWAQFDRTCAVDDLSCRAVGHASQHAAHRLSKVRNQYPNASVDLLLIESSKDIAILHGGITFVAKRGSDIITILRIRDCDANTSKCTTRLIDEYRYEGETLTSDVIRWYPIVASLRGVAQSYYWIRVAMLYLGCYYAVAGAAGTSTISKKNKDGSPDTTTPVKMSFLMTTRKALALFFKVPSQVVIYGSVFPLICYVIAHIIDSPIVYELAAEKFDSFNGLFHMAPLELVSFGSIQMRNVWVIATVVHLVVRVATQRNGWTPVRGVWGMPQFSIALISSLTILSQFRFISLRRTPVSAIQRMHVISRLHPVLESLFYVNGSGIGGKATLAGVFLDLKAMACSTAALACVAMTISLIIRLCFRRSSVKDLIFWRAHSPTPFSACVLWPTNALAVSWDDQVFHFYNHHYPHVKAELRVPSGPKLSASSSSSSVTCPAPGSSTKKKIYPATPPSTTVAASSNSRTHCHQTTTVLTEPTAWTSLDDRPEAVEAVMYLMNLTMLSDPIAFLAWKWSSSKTLIGCYISEKTQRKYLVPVAHIVTTATTRCRPSDLDWSDFVCEQTVSADELTWSEVLTCG